MTEAVTASACRPFLRWAGGKRWLVPRVLSMLGDRQIGRYFEPFLGGASMYFSALECERGAALSDTNLELVEMYQEVRDNVESVIKALKRHRNEKEYYYQLRAKTCTKGSDRAARFIYLNQTSFNGIYRVNLNGEYNVPFGSRSNDHFRDYDNLRLASARLQNAELTGCDFAEAVDSARAGDFVFLDPPYTVSHNNNGFIKYNQRLFSMEDQERLRDVLAILEDRSVLYAMTNAAHPSVKELFRDVGSPVRISRANVIGGTRAQRGRADEYLFTNLEAAG